MGEYMFDTPVIIAAAGMGKRLGMGRPKCLVCVNGKPILDYQLEMLREARDVRIVVGFRAEEVIARAKSLRPDITIVRNDDFAYTATLHSLALAARDVEGNCLCMDGDMIVERHSFRNFLGLCASGTAHIAISGDIAEDPVYAATEQQDDALHVTGFSRVAPAAFEWANIAFLPAHWLKASAHWGQSSVFSLLEGHLPLAAAIVRRLEVDTPEDLLCAENELRLNPAWREGQYETCSADY